MPTNPATEMKRIKRLLAIEKLYLSNFGPLKIHQMLCQGKDAPFDVAYGTIRQDIVDIKKAHADDYSEMNKLEGHQKLLAQKSDLRDKAVDGWDEEGKFGLVKKGVELALAAKLDEDIAKMTGVEIVKAGVNLNLTIEAAQDYMGNVMAAIYSVVTDTEMREQIVEAITALAEGE